MADRRSDHVSWPRRLLGVSRKLAGLVVVVVVNLVLLTLLLELGSAAFYCYRKHDFFYLRSTVNIPDINLAAQTIPSTGFHPYFGFAHLQTYLPANNHGFANQFNVSYPYRPGANEFVVGIFGGSVAGVLGFNGEQLVAALSRKPRFANKKVTVLNFAVSGFKQPQQWAVLAYYLAIGQHYDAIVNIDGLNEVVSGSRNIEQGRDASMPANDILGSYVNMIDHAAPNAVLPPYYSLRRIEFLRRNQQCRFAMCELATILAAHLYHRWYLQALTTSALGPKPTHFVIYDAPQPAPGDKVPDPFAVVADLWAKSSLEMARAAAAENVFYLHVLQPNQYYATNRKMSDRERREVINDSSYVKQPVVVGYPELLARIPALQRAGVDVVDGTHMFDRIDPGIVIYADDCCHYLEPGREALVDFVADNLERLVAAQEKKAVAR